VREWTLTLPSELPLWDLESQWTSESSENNCKGQTHWIETLMSKMGSHDPFRSLKRKLWPQKNGRDSNCPFDFNPLKVRNRPDFLTFRWHATYHWKAFNEVYNFASNLISIKGLHTKLWPSKVTEVLILRISGLPFESLKTKWHLGDEPVVRHKVYYKGGRWWLPPSPNHDESCESYESVVTRGSFMHQKGSNSTLTNLLFGLCKSIGIIELLIILPIPIPELQHTLLPLKCCEQRNAPQLLFLSLSSSLGS
jgi:hypothetical protein